MGCECPGFVFYDVYSFAKLSMQNELSLGKTPSFYRAYHFGLVCVSVRVAPEFANTLSKFVN